MDPWQTLVIVGAAIAGYGWLAPQAKKGREPEAQGKAADEAYDLLLEDLEEENRQLVDAVAAFKQEQDETVRRLGARIRELEAQMSDWKVRGASLEAPSVASQAKAETATGSAAAEPAIASVPEEPAAAMSAAAAEELAAAERAGEPAAEAAAEPALAPQSIRARYPELLELHDRGRSVEQLAKALGLNKGEVQLILQLAKREEERHG